MVVVVVVVVVEGLELVVIIVAAAEEVIVVVLLWHCFPVNIVTHSRVLINQVFVKPTYSVV